MIEPIEWNARHDELPSPFMPGEGQRNLRITLDSESFIGLPSEEEEALIVLRELGHLPSIDLVETQPGEFPHLQIDFRLESKDSIPVQVVANNQIVCWTSVMFRSQWHRIAHGLAQYNALRDTSDDLLFRQLVTAQAHLAAGGDVFVTFASPILTNRDKVFLRSTNSRTPSEAAKIVGLFLRSRDIYTCQANLDFRGRWMFYWVLARHHLPNMWRYFSACLAAGKSSGDNTDELGHAVLHRASRALQARDAIGFRYYSPQDNDTRERMLYHFDYLTLLLSGAFDAQARIARRAYRIHQPKKEPQTSFRNPEFLRELETRAPRLCRLVTNEYRTVLALVSGLRNTIHGAPLAGMGSKTSGLPENSYIAVPKGVVLGDLAEVFGDDAKGLMVNVGRLPLRLLSPYPLSVLVVEKCLSAIDGIANATEIERLLPDDTPPLTLLSESPSDGVFALASQFALLG